MDVSYLLKLDLTAWPRKIYDVWHNTSSHPLQPPSSRHCSVFSAGHLQVGFRCQLQSYAQKSCLYFNIILPAFISSCFIFHVDVNLPLKCQVLGMQLKSVASLLDASAGTRQQFEEHLEQKKKSEKSVQSILIKRRETWRDKHSAVLLSKSDKWSQKMRLRGPYQSRMCPGTERGMLLCDKGVRADKHVCVKCFKDELNSYIKVRFERKRERGGGEGGELGLQLASVGL